MMGFHSGNVTVRKEISSKERKMTEVMYCLCGYSSQYGNIIGKELSVIFGTREGIDDISSCLIKHSEYNFFLKLYHLLF